MVSFLWLLASIPSIDPAIVALIGTVFGGVGLKVIEHYLGKKSEKREDRRDLLQEVADLVKRVDTLENEVTFWRHQYYSEAEKVHLLRIQMVNAGLTPADNLTLNLKVDPPQPDE